MPMKYDVSTIEEYLDPIPADRKEIVLKLISIVNEYFPNETSSRKLTRYLCGIIIFKYASRCGELRP